MQDGRFVYVISSALCAGLALVLLSHPSLVLIIFVLCASALSAMAGLILRSAKFFIVSAILAALCLGMLRADMALRTEAAETLPTYAGQTALVGGRVVADPDRRETSLHITVQVEKVNGAQASGKLLALLPRDEEVSYNDAVVLQGTLTKPESFETDTGHTFDYPGYLRAQGISVQMKHATVKTRTAGGPTLLGFLYTLKHQFEHSLERLYPEPDGSLEEGILLGEKHGIPQSMTNVFIKSGLVHVVVLSGYNIAIVSEGVFRVLSFLPRVVGLGVGGLVMILFALMTGAGSATMRALFMALIALLARYMHRSTVALRTLVLAATAMALWNPESLLHDSSFILSVLATFGLVTLSPSVERHLPSFLKKYPSIRSIAASTIAVQLFVLPALLYFSGVFSLVSAPANVLALPVVPLAMLGGFVAGLLGFISPILGFIPAVLSDLLLKWMMLVANTAAATPFGAITINEFTPWFLVLAYLPLTWFAVRRYEFDINYSQQKR